MNLLPDVKDGQLLETPEYPADAISYGYMFSMLSDTQREKLCRLMRRGLNAIQALHLVALRRHHVVQQ